MGPTRNPAGLLVLGSGPTKDEVKAQEQLSGAMGKEMNEALENAGIDKQRILVANAFACMSTEPKQAKLERLAVKCCRPLLRHYIGALPPSTPVLVSGKWALLALTGTDKGLFDTRGFVDMQWNLSKVVKDEHADKIEQAEKSAEDREEDSEKPGGLFCAED